MQAEEKADVLKVVTSMGNCQLEFRRERLWGAWAKCGMVTC